MCLKYEHVTHNVTIDDFFHDFCQTLIRFIFKPKLRQNVLFVPQFNLNLAKFLEISKCLSLWDYVVNFTRYTTKTILYMHPIAQMFWWNWVTIETISSHQTSSISSKCNKCFRKWLTIEAIPFVNLYDKRRRFAPLFRWYFTVKLL